MEILKKSKMYYIIQYAIRLTFMIKFTIFVYVKSTQSQLFQAPT